MPKQQFDDPSARAAALQLRSTLDGLVNYIPAWVKAAVAFA